MTRKIGFDQIGGEAGDTAKFYSAGDGPAAPALQQPGRAFFGLGWNHGQQVAGQVTGGSWLQSFPSPGATNPVTGWGYIETQARVSSVSFTGIAVSGAARTGDGSDGSTLQSIGVLGASLNDAPTSRKAWGGYFDGVSAHPDAAVTHGVEIDAARVGSVSAFGGMTPYKSYPPKDGPGFTTVLTLAAGSDAAAVYGRTYAVDAFINIQGNGGAAHTGINFRFNGLLRDGMADDRTEPANVAGYARAIALPYDYGFSWYSRDSAGAPGDGNQAEVVRLYSSVTDAAVRWRQVFSNQSWDINEASGPGNSLFRVEYNPTAQNFVTVHAGSAGEWARIRAVGVDANVTLRLEPQGSGRISIPVAAVPSYADQAAARADSVLGVGALYRVTGSDALHIKTVQT